MADQIVTNRSVKLRKALVLVGVMVFGSIGDSLLSRGMKSFGTVSLAQLSHVLAAVQNPWVFLGILFLLGFMACYLTALSWADLTFVLPATSVGYILIAVIARFGLHEHISPVRWLGIVLITAGVGFVAGGPSHTPESAAAHRLTHPDDLQESR